MSWSVKQDHDTSVHHTQCSRHQPWICIHISISGLNGWTFSLFSGFLRLLLLVQRCRTPGPQPIVKMNFITSEGLYFFRNRTIFDPFAAWLARFIQTHRCIRVHCKRSDSHVITLISCSSASKWGTWSGIIPGQRSWRSSRTAISASLRPFTLWKRALWSRSSRGWWHRRCATRNHLWSPWFHRWRCWCLYEVFVESRELGWFQFQRHQLFHTANTWNSRRDSTNMLVMLLMMG